jgi:hypothetical protein
VTAYKNFVQDFPNRCMDLLKLAEEPPRKKDREVTLALMVASAGFVIPFERLRPPGKIDNPVGDREKYSNYSEKLKNLMDTNFRGSTLHPENVTDWQAGSLKSIQGDPDGWQELSQDKTLVEAKTVGNVLKEIRNALAHGNVFTKGNPISSVVFVSVDTKTSYKKTEGKEHHLIIDDEKIYVTEKHEIKGYSFVSMSPESFLNFLKLWFKFVQSQNISQYEVAKELENAA